ncbi:MAG: hypothetical protein WA755_08570 [Candidatus Acidiferrales bacterium]
MIKRMLWLSALCVFLMSMFAVSAPPARAQQSEPPKQPTVYTYVSFFGVPRAQWAEYEKSLAPERKVFEGLFADGTLVGYGEGALEVHEGLNAPTHVGWFASSSVAGLMKTLAALRNTAPTASEIAYTMHSDSITMSTMYGGKGGSSDGGYILVQDWTPKPGHTDEFMDLFAKYRKPSLDASVADGTLSGYSVDEELIHTDTPGTFSLIAAFPNAAAMDKFYAEIDALHKTNPLFGSAYSTVVDYSTHRDHLLRILFSKSK